MEDFSEAVIFYSWTRQHISIVKLKNLKSKFENFSRHLLNFVWSFLISEFFMKFENERVSGNCFQKLRKLFSSKFTHFPILFLQFLGYWLNTYAILLTNSEKKLFLFWNGEMKLEWNQRSSYISRVMHW